MGKYLSVAELLTYGRAGAAKPEEEQVLAQAIARAEAWFEGVVGGTYLYTSWVAVAPAKAMIDRMGVLHLLAGEGAPIRSIESVEVRFPGESSWRVVPLGDISLAPIIPGKPSPGWWLARVRGTKFLPAAPGEFEARWSYTSGFQASEIPEALKSLIARLAWWIYKLREAPMGKVVTAELGLMEIPLEAPPDIKSDLGLWRRPWG